LSIIKNISLRHSREIICNYFVIVTTHKAGRLHVEFLLSQQVARAVTSLL